MLKLAGRLGRGTARLLHALGAIVLTFVLAALLGAGALTWRLAQGPLELEWLARRIEAAANTAGSPTRLSIGHASLAWEGYRRGFDRPLEVRLDELRAVDSAGSVIADVPHAEVSLSIGWLLVGQVVPRVVIVDGARVRLVRAADGSLGLNFGGPEDDPAAATPDTAFSRILGELVRPSAGDASRADPGNWRLAQLRRVLVHDAQVEVIDRQLGADWRAGGAEIDLVRQPRGGMTGTADMDLTLGDVHARLQGRAGLTAADGTTHVEFNLSPVSPAALARAVPLLQPLTGLTAALQVDASVDLTPAFLPTHTTLHAQIGHGAAGPSDGMIALDSGVLDVTTDWDGPVLRRAAVPRFRLVIPSPGGGWSTTLQGTAELAVAERATAHVMVDLDHVTLADLPRLWPPLPGVHARDWVVENLSAGAVRSGHVEVTLESAADMSGVQVTALSGGLTGEDVSINWLRPVPPVEHVAAVLTLLGPDALEITASGGRQGGMVLRQGTMRITGLSVKDQVANIALDVGGSVPDLIQLLRHPRLELLDKHPIPVTAPAGAFTGHLTVYLPLEQKLDFDQVRMHGQLRATDVHLGAIALGRDLDRGTLSADVTNDGMKVVGDAVLAGAPSHMQVEMDFRDGPPGQVVQQITVRAHPTARQVGAAGLDVAGMAQGSAGLDAVYAEQRGGKAEVRLRADLTDASLTVLGWSKPPGAAAHAAGRVLLDQGRVVGADGVQADGPGLLLQARTVFVDNRPSILKLDRAVLGRTQATGEIRFATRPNDPIRATLAGPSLDLSSQFGQGRTSAAGGHESTPYVVDARFDRVLLAGGAAAGPLVAHVEHDASRLRQARIELGGALQVLAVLTPQDRSRSLSVHTNNAGALLQALDVLGELHGGELNVQGRFDDSRASSPLSGDVQMTGFSIKDAPVVGKLLQALTLYGLVEALQGPGLVFNRLDSSFSYADDALDLTEARASSASLGLTAHGRIDLARQMADLHGTIVPAYVLNSALGRLPVVGKLFSPERGGGLLAATFAVRGKLSDPSVAVNPLAALTPGFLRGLFNVFK